MITVHTFTALGQYLAADVNSGAVHVLDKLTYDLLKLVGEGPIGEGRVPQKLVDQLPQYQPAELEEGWQELRVLQNAGLLFTTDDYLDPEAAMALPKAAVVKALCLHVSHRRLRHRTPDDHGLRDRQKGHRLGGGQVGQAAEY